MFPGDSGKLLLGILIGLALIQGPVVAGMPAPLPTNWTKDSTPSWARSSETAADNGSGNARLQAISFFVACLLLSAWGVRWLCRVLRKEVTRLPELTYCRSLSLVVLWGLLFVIVLTMISGARELMTPGAWRKQGWTYKLAEVNSRPATEDSWAERKRALEHLRTLLWQYAATHQGQFPTANDPAIDAELWNVPGWPGLKFFLVSDRSAEKTGRLLVFEPDVEGDERQVLLTNGFIGTMRASEIGNALDQEP